MSSVSPCVGLAARRRGDLRELLRGARRPGRVGDREHADAARRVALGVELAHERVGRLRRVGVLAVGEQHDGVDAARVGELLDLRHAVRGGVVDRRAAVGDEP